MPDFKPWRNLSKTEREQVALMLFSLKEFSYAFDRASSIGMSVPEGSATMRFYTNALYHYSAAYFTVGGAFKLRNVIKDLGSADLLQPIDEVLGSKIDRATFGEIMDTFRDKFLVHQSFRISLLEKHIFEKCDLTNAENAEDYARLVQKLFVRTQDLYVALAERFPEVDTYDPDAAT